MRKRRRRLSAEGIELNLAAMLDMAFQLLMFFILTFNPAQVESQVAAYMPALEPVTKPKAETSKSDPQVVQASATNEVVITVAGSKSGQIERLAVGGKVVDNLGELNASVHNALCRQEKCEGLTVQVDARLCYEELMQVVDVCTRQELPTGGKLSKLKLVELRGE
jgi:biopolymer transport protein ExbD